MDRRRNQAPLVETSGCLCRGDASLRTNTVAKKFVPGSSTCTQSGVKASIHPAGQKGPRAGRSQSQSPLIPGLPDDLAIACLIRVPRAEHRRLRLVCRKWKSLLAGNYFHSLRKSGGIAEEWLYVLKRDRDGRTSWDAFDPSTLSWQPLPPVPREFSEAVGFGCAVLGGCHLYLFGGRDHRPAKGGSMRRVVFYSARTNKWHRAPDMLRRRYLFGSCVIGNRLYVSGGEGEGERYLKTAEMYDPGRNRWFFISEMGVAMLPFLSAAHGGRWYLKGTGADGREVLGEVYDPESDRWQTVSGGMIAGWQSPSGCLHGKVYASDCRDGCRLRVYDEGTGSWSGRIDGRMHLGSSPALEAKGLVALNGKLCIVRNNLSITLVDVGGSEGTGNGEATAAKEANWETIAGKGQVRTFVTNLWSTIAGRSHLRQEVVHCQVLQA